MVTEAASASGSAVIEQDPPWSCGAVPPPGGWHAVWERQRPVPGDASRDRLRRLGGSARPRRPGPSRRRSHTDTEVPAMPLIGSVRGGAEAGVESRAEAVLAAL